MSGEGTRLSVDQQAAAPPLLRRFEHGLTAGVKHLLLPASGSEHRVELKAGADANRLVLQAEYASDASIGDQHAVVHLLRPGLCGADADGDANGRCSWDRYS